MSSSHGFYIWVLQVIGLLGLLVLFLWLAVRPHDPTYTVVDFSIPSNSTAAPFLGLEIANENKEGDVHYDDIAVALFLGERAVCSATIPAFYQGNGRATDWRGDLGGGAACAALRAVANGTMELTVGLVTAVWYRIWGVRSKTHGMDMQATLPVGSDGRVAGKKQIKLHKVRRRRRVQL